MKQIFLILTIFILTAVMGFAQGTSSPTQGVFTSVSGKVQVKSKSGKKTRIAQKDSTVMEGERIVTDKDAKATLRLFDGSDLTISPQTDFRLAKLQKPSVQDKIMQFKLFAGKLLAQVKKLASAKSSFEIEAGGVVCGVRGTQFSMAFDPDKNTVYLNILEGSVFANAGGNTIIFNAGQQMEFINGLPNGNTGGNNPPPNNQGQGNNSPGGSFALGDLNNQFLNGLAVNGDNNFTNPNVEGSVHIRVNANVPPAETAP